MTQNDKYTMTPQEEEELIASSEEIEEEECAAGISEEKAEAIAVRLSEISTIIDNYVEAHPDRYQDFLNGEREESPINPTPSFQTKFREKKR